MGGLSIRQRKMTRTRVNSSSITLSFDSFPSCSGLFSPGDASIFLLCDLDTRGLMVKMEELEKGGAYFKDIEKKDVRQKRYIGAFIASAAMVTFMAGLIVLMVWDFKTHPQDALPLPVLLLIIAVPSAVIVGVVMSLAQRIGEIKKGEVDDARKF